MSRVIILFSIVLFSIYQTEQAYFLTDEFIDQINGEAITWKAGKNFPADTPVEYFKSILGSKNNGAHTDGPLKTRDLKFTTFQNVHENFDSRNMWKQCRTIGVILDQGQCDNSWALSTMSAFSDRLCIATNGEFNQILSAEELTFCCDSCGDGCKGGKPIEAWNYFNDNGLVTGGHYGTKKGCQSYRVPPCSFDERGNNPCSTQSAEDNHRCSAECYGETDIDYRRDHVYAKNGYYLSPDVFEQDVMAYGPVEASFDVYTDFLSYKSGVYSKTSNATSLGRQSGKMIGWGVEEGVRYWLMVNSWNSTWGDSGTFKIRRDTNECGIEDSVTAGMIGPNIYKKNFVH